MEKQERIKLNKELLPQGKKCCPKCDEIKLIDDFTTTGKYPNGKPRYHYCKSCVVKRNKDIKEIKPDYFKNASSKYRKNNPERIIDGYKNYAKKNKEKLKLKRRKYYLDNRKKEIEKAKKNYLIVKDLPQFKQNKNIKSRKKYLTDDNYRFGVLLMGHIRTVSNRQEFKDIWDDVREVYDFYGIPYHIDHKVPKSWFKVGSAKGIINHLDNLQVIDKNYNLSKLNRWSDPVPSDYLEKIRPYIKKEYQGLLKSL